MRTRNYILCLLLAMPILSTVAQTSNGNVTRDASRNQVALTLGTDAKEYHNTANILSIDMTGNEVTITKADGTYTYNNIRDLSFVKATEARNGRYDNAEGRVRITDAKGWLESAYITFEPIDGAKTYNVYVKGGQYEDYTLIDQQLVRDYGSYGRADIVGLRTADDYSIRIVPVSEDKTEMNEKANEATDISVRRYSREGFAHKTWTAGVGAYNDDGTLKEGARVIYVTSKTAKTVKASVVTSSKGGAEEFTGLQSIIDAYQKGYDTTPLSVRLIGMINADDIDHFSSSAEGLQIKGKKADSELNITIEGVGEDATIYGFGFLLRNAMSVEIRNLAIMQCMDDGISMDTDNSNIWVHHVDVFYGKNKGGDQKKGDGAIDVKSDSKYVTIDNCHFWDTGKSSMCGMKSESAPNYITYHHNWFDHSDSRHARVRTMSVHMWNNYFDNVAKYGVGATSASSVFVENNYFKNTKKPILISLQGTDAQGSGTFSGEDGGMIKAYGNYFDREAKNFKYYTQANAASTGYDAYETETRHETVPATEVTRAGGTPYNNFDTDETIMYIYKADNAEDVPARVTGYYGAGRMNHGDFKYTFTDNVGNDDTDSDIDSALEALIKSYKSSLIGIFGDDVLDDEQGENDKGKDDGNVNEDGSITCSFDKSGTPSNPFFTVTGNGSNSKGSCTVDGTTYTTCLKMESSTSIEFTLEKAMTMTLYFAEGETASIKIDGGSNLRGSDNTLTRELGSGSHKLTKGDSVNLFYIKLVPVSE